MSFLLQNLGVISLSVAPAHLFQIAVLVRYRKASAFRATYFALLLSLTFNDLFFCISKGFTDIWINTDSAKENYPRLSATLDQACIYASVAGNEIALVSIAINRFIFLCYPFEAQTWWRPIFTKVAIAVQWIGFGLFASLFVPSDGHVVLNGTNEMFGVPNNIPYNPDSEFNNIRDVVCSAIDLLFGMAILVLYSIVIISVLKHKLNTNNNAATEQQGYGVEIRLTAQGFLLSSTVIGQGSIYGVGVMISEVLEGKALYYLVIAYVCCFYGNFLTGPFVSFGMSKNLRNHARKMFSRNKVTPVGKNNKGKKGMGKVGQNPILL